MPGSWSVARDIGPSWRLPPRSPRLSCDFERPSVTLDRAKAQKRVGTLNYIEWVDHVARAVASRTATSGWIVRPTDIVATTDPTNEAIVAVFDAIEDLVSIGVVDGWTNRNFIEDSQNLRAIRGGASLMTTWPRMMEPWLDEEQVAFLSRIVTVTEQTREDFATVVWTAAEEVYSDLGWALAAGDPFHLAQSLERLGFAKVRAALGGPVQVRPTYQGVVRATQRVLTEWRQRLADMVEEWETTTVEFKRELDLGTVSKNAEFARDVIALATTKASGRERYLILGYDPKSREFTTTAPPTVSQDGLEDILNEYVEPAPAIRYFTVDHESYRGVVGVLEITRDATQVLYRLRRDGGKRRAGEVFVRHGSHVEPPTQAELDALLAEGELARSQGANRPLPDSRTVG